MTALGNIIHIRCEQLFLFQSKCDEVEKYHTPDGIRTHDRSITCRVF